MATSFIIAVTAHREVGGMGQRGEQRQQPVVAGLFISAMSCRYFDGGGGRSLL
jgi:hypothetical protein